MNNNSEWTGIKNLLINAFDDFEKWFDKRFGWFFTNGRK